jgi:hypothetical protein
MYLKITNEAEIHNNLQYHDGLVKDILPFEPEGSCVSGGIYFTTPEHICEFLYYGVWIREVTIPEDAQIVQDPEGEKWRADKVVLSPRRDLREVETWKWLVEIGADIHAGGCSLKYSAANGHFEIVKYLVEHGADIHVWDDYALRHSASYGHLEVLKYLVEHGADIHANYDDALRYSAEYGYLEVVKYLVENGANIHAYNDEALIWSAKKGHLEVVKCLIENGANIHAQNDDALRNSAENGHLEVVKYLVEHGANEKGLIGVTGTPIYLKGPEESNP